MSHSQRPRITFFDTTGPIASRTLRIPSYLQPRSHIPGQSSISCPSNAMVPSRSQTSRSNQPSQSHPMSILTASFGLTCDEILTDGVNRSGDSNNREQFQLKRDLVRTFGCLSHTHPAWDPDNEASWHYLFNCHQRRTGHEYGIGCCGAGDYYERESITSGHVHRIGRSSRRGNNTNATSGGRSSRGSTDMRRRIQTRNPTSTPPPPYRFTATANDSLQTTPRLRYQSSGTHRHTSSGFGANDSILVERQRRARQRANSRGSNHSRSRLTTIYTTP